MKNVNSPKHSRFYKRIISSFYSNLKTSWRSYGSHLHVFEKLIFFNYFRQLTDVYTDVNTDVYTDVYTRCVHRCVRQMCVHITQVVAYKMEPPPVSTTRK